MSSLGNVISFKEAKKRQLAKRFDFVDSALEEDTCHDELMAQMIQKLNGLIDSFEKESKLPTTAADNATS